MRTATILASGSVVGLIAAACIVNGNTHISGGCGKRWAAQTVGAQGQNGLGDWVDIKKDDEWIEAWECLTEVEAEDADDEMSEIYEDIQVGVIGDCEYWAIEEMGLGNNNCATHVGTPFADGDCFLDVDACDPGVADGGETGGDDGEDDGMGDIGSEIDCDGNTCVLSDQLIDDLLAAPESTWDEEGFELELLNIGGRDGWELSGVTAGSMADQLGFQDDDFLLEMDGIELDSFAALLVAGTYALAQDSIRVKYQRSSNTLYKTFVRTCASYQNYETTDYDWFDLSSVGTGTSVADDGEVNVSLPFGFQFYGNVYSQIWVSGNGALRFNSGDLSPTNASLPSSASSSPDIAMFWDDLNPTTAGDAYYYNDSSNGRFIISWEGTPHYYNVGEGDMQVHLYESGRIEFHYQDANFGNSSYNHGASATVGIQDHVGATTASHYRQITYNTAWETGMDSQARAFDPDCN